MSRGSLGWTCSDWRRRRLAKVSGRSDGEADTGTGRLRRRRTRMGRCWQGCRPLRWETLRRRTHRRRGTGRARRRCRGRGRGVSGTCGPSKSGGKCRTLEDRPYRRLSLNLPPNMPPFLILLLFLLLHPCSAHSSSLLFLHQFSPTSPDGSWLWAWVWGAESSVSVVDRSPPLTFHSRPAAFGPELDDPLLGYVLPLSSFTSPCPPRPNASNSACPPLCHIGPHRPDPKEPWIALVQRGDCPFVDKEGPLSSHPISLSTFRSGQRSPTARCKSRRRRWPRPRSHRSSGYPHQHVQ